jgi:predicted CXXCH cytochrome family protein
MRGVALIAGLLAALLAGCTSGVSTSSDKQFVGSEKCKSCHTSEYATWKGTLHSKMIRTAKDGLLKDAGDNWAKDSKGNAGPTKANISGTPAKMEDIVFVVGSKWKQRFLVKNPASGGHQFLDKQWNSLHKQWEPYGQKNTWETQCATCHATGYKVLEVDDKRAVKKWAMTEENTGCEACHGPGSAHAVAGDKKQIFNPGKAAVGEDAKVCGYCHIRVENDYYKTAEGNHSEHLPHPQLGQSYKAGTDDWTTWYPDKVLMVGIQPEDVITKNYPNTDLNNAFFIDDAAQKSGYFEARKHHQEYQEHLQSKHAKGNVAGCTTCHWAHSSAAKPKRVAGADTCKSCHGDAMNDLDKFMPGLASTAQNLFVRAHTFNPNISARKGGPTIPATAPEPAYYYKK